MQKTSSVREMKAAIKYPANRSWHVRLRHRLKIPWSTVGSTQWRKTWSDLERLKFCSRLCARGGVCGVIRSGFTGAGLLGEGSGFSRSSSTIELGRNCIMTDQLQQERRNQANQYVDEVQQNIPAPAGPRESSNGADHQPTFTAEKFRVLFLEGPPFCDKHGIVKEAVAKLKEIAAMPDAVNGAAAPFIMGGTSPWRSALENEPIHWVDPNSDELSLGDLVQLERARMRRTLDLMGEPMWGFSFTEGRPVFTVCPGLGPVTAQAWAEMYQQLISEKWAETYPEKDQPKGGARDRYLRVLQQFLKVEEERWDELGFVSVIYTPKRTAIKRTRKRVNRQELEEADNKQDWVKRVDLDLNSTDQLSKLMRGIGKQSKYQCHFASTRAIAVQMIVKLLEPAWKKTVQDWDLLQNGPAAPAELDKQD